MTPEKLTQEEVIEHLNGIEEVFTRLLGFDFCYKNVTKLTFLDEDDVYEMKCMLATIYAFKTSDNIKAFLEDTFTDPNDVFYVPKLINFLLHIQAKYKVKREQAASKMGEVLMNDKRGAIIILPTGDVFGSKIHSLFRDKLEGAES